MAGSLSDGIVAHWKMNDVSGTTVVDNIGGFNGTWTRDVSNDSVTGKIDKALYPNDANYAACGNNTAFDYNTPFSVACWVKRDVAGVKRALIGKWAAISRGWFCQFRDTNKLWFLLYHDGSHSTGMETTNTYTSTGTWVHWTFTYDGSGARTGIRIYRNASSVALTAIGQTTLSDTVQVVDPLTLATHLVGSTIFNGSLDDIRIYDRELIQDDIDLIYNGGAGTEDDGGGGGGATDSSTFFGSNF
ncbi:MAG: hypothetical protein DRP42_02760 [Tenericutes bacterium]|nr:MAG: hypothetical protein DRP42_02760 [Mycoplasmatota bacterium]